MYPDLLYPTHKRYDGVCIQIYCILPIVDMMVSVSGSTVSLYPTYSRYDGICIQIYCILSKEYMLVSVSRSIVF